MDVHTFGIKAKNDLGRRIVLRENNYRVWSTVLEQSLREKKLWVHVMGTAVPPSPARVIAPGVAAVAANGVAPGVAAVAEVSREMVKADKKELEDFEAAIARANTAILLSLQEKDVMAISRLDTPALKWAKLEADYATKSQQKAAKARACFHAYRRKESP